MAGLRERYDEILQEVTDLAKEAGASPPKVVAVSKYAPDEAVQEALEAGIRDFGESRAQDFSKRLERLGRLDGVSWHFIGHLQTNKVSKVVGSTSLIHSVDSCRLLESLDGRARRTGAPPVPVLLQVNVSGEPQKSGFAPDGLEPALEFARRLDHVEVRGLMTMAPAEADEAAVRGCFSGLREAHEGLRERMPDTYTGTELSMGMSQDYRLAVLEGATMVRIGSAIFSEGAH